MRAQANIKAALNSAKLSYQLIKALKSKYEF